MATFGNVLAPNALFNLAQADSDILANRRAQQIVNREDATRALEPELAAGGERAAAARRRLIAIDPTRGAQLEAADALRAQRIQQASQEELTLRSGLARALLSMPEGSRQPFYQSFIQEQKARGLFPHAPDQVPPEDHLRGLMAYGQTAPERVAAENQRAIQGILGGGAPAAAAAPAGPSVAPAPIGGGNVRAQNQDAAALRADAMASLQGPALEARLAEISAGRAVAANGVPVGTRFWAADGVDGAYRGLPAPTGAVPVIGDVRADAGPTTGGVASRYPGAADVAGDGVIPESVTQAVLGPQPPRRGTLGPNAARAEAFIAGNAPEPGLGGYAPDGTDELARSYAQAAPAPQPAPQPAPAAPAAPVQADPPGVDTNVAEGMLARMSGAPAPVAVPEVAVTAPAPVPLPPAAPPGPPQTAPQAPRPVARPVRTNALLGVASDGSADRLNEISLNLARGNMLADSPEARNIDRAMGTNRFAGAAAAEAMPAMGSITRENLPDVRPAVRPGTRQNALLPPAQAVVPFAQSQVATQPSEPSPRQEAPREITPVADGGRAAAGPNVDGMRAQADDLRSKALRLAALGNQQATAAANTLTAQAEAIERRMRDERDFEDRRSNREDTRQTQEEIRRTARETREATERAAKEQRDLARLQSITKEEDPLVDRIASSSQIMANGDRLLGMIEKKQIPFGATAGVQSAVRGAFNSSNAGDVAREELRRHVEQSVNAVLNAAAGPQTNQDADRARNQILNNLNDEGQVRAGLIALNGAMQRAREEATARVQGRREALGLPRRELDAFSNARPTAVNGQPDVAPSGADPVRVNSPEEAAKLAPGTEFLTPDGRRMRVPAR